jgi:hypothetical protein
MTVFNWHTQYAGHRIWDSLTQHAIPVSRSRLDNQARPPDQKDFDQKFFYEQDMTLAVNISFGTGKPEKRYLTQYSIGKS